MAKPKEDETKILGFTVPQAIVVVILAVLTISAFGYGPWADDVSEVGAQSTVTPDVVVVGDLELDSAFVSMIVNTTTVADVDNNYNEATNVVSAQFDTSVDSSNSVNTTFVLSTKDSSGSTIQLLSFIEDGTLIVPVTDQTVAVTINIDNSVLAGFGTTDEVKYASVSASANSLSDDAGTAFYPVTVRASDTTKPSVKIDTVLDTKSYSWLASSATKNIDITFDISWTGVSKMKDISDKISVPVIIEGGDDSPITIEMVRNAAIL